MYYITFRLARGGLARCSSNFCILRVIDRLHRLGSGAWRIGEWRSSDRKGVVVGAASGYGIAVIILTLTRALFCAIWAPPADRARLLASAGKGFNFHAFSLICGHLGLFVILFMTIICAYWGPCSPGGQRQTPFTGSQSPLSPQLHTSIHCGPQSPDGHSA